MTFMARIFGGGDRSDSSQRKFKDSDGLQVAGEGSGVIYKKMGKRHIVTNNHVVDGAKNSKSCFQMDQKLLVNSLVKILTLT